jgi:hypothetical protein
MIHDGKKSVDWKNYNKNFNQQITMDIWMTKFGPYFQKSQFWSFFVGLIYNKKNSKWAAFHMHFINWLITT